MKVNQNILTISTKVWDDDLVIPSLGNPSTSLHGGYVDANVSSYKVGDGYVTKVNVKSNLVAWSKNLKKITLVFTPETSTANLSDVYVASNRCGFFVEDGKFCLDITNSCKGITSYKEFEILSTILASTQPLLERVKSTISFLLVKFLVFVLPL